MRLAKVHWTVCKLIFGYLTSKKKYHQKSRTNQLLGMSKALAKEVEPFNIRVLTVLLGTFNTGMGNAAVLGQNPLPEDYKDSMSEKIMEAISTGKFAPNGDKDKAMKAVYEVVVGEGVGENHEAERVLPLGRDLAARIQVVQDYLSHSVEIFGNVCNNVYLEGK